MAEFCLVQVFARNLLPSRHQRPSPSYILLKGCRTRARGKEQKSHLKGQGYPQLCHSFPHPLLYTQHAPKAESFYPSISSQLALTFITVARHKFQRSFTEQSLFSGSSLLKILLRKQMALIFSPRLHLLAILTVEGSFHYPLDHVYTLKQCSHLQLSPWLVLGQKPQVALGIQ